MGGWLLLRRPVAAAEGVIMYALSLSACRTALHRAAKGLRWTGWLQLSSTQDMGYLLRIT